MKADVKALRHFKRNMQAYEIANSIALVSDKVKTRRTKALGLISDAKVYMTNAVVQNLNTILPSLMWPNCQTLEKALKFVCEAKGLDDDCEFHEDLDKFSAKGNAMVTKSMAQAIFDAAEKHGKAKNPKALAICKSKVRDTIRATLFKPVPVALSKDISTLYKTYKLVKKSSLIVANRGDQSFVDLWKAVGVFMKANLEYYALSKCCNHIINIFESEKSQRAKTRKAQECLPTSKGVLYS